MSVAIIQKGVKMKKNDKFPILEMSIGEWIAFVIVCAILIFSIVLWIDMPNEYYTHHNTYFIGR
jgi:hypothetical protein